MSRLIKGVALFMAVVCPVWLGVLWHWQATQEPVQTSHVIVYLGLIPLAVFGLVVLFRLAWQSVAARRAAAADAAARSRADTAAAAAPQADAEAAGRERPVQLLASAVTSRCGSTGGELLAALTDGAPGPELDFALRDDDGLPVMCAALAESSPVDLDAALAAVRGRHDAWAGLDPPAHVARALAALADPLARMLQALESAPGWADADEPRQLRLQLAWPETWSDFDQALAEAWLLGLLQEHAPAVAQGQRLVLSGARQGGVALWRQVDQLLLLLAREKCGDPVLVAACHSDISVPAVEALERAGSLFSARRRPKGRMPGEAAAALLLAGPDWPAPPAAVNLQRAAFAERDESVDTARRVEGGALHGALGQALAAARLQGADVAAVFSDADRHSARSTELLRAALPLLPQLDAGADLGLLGAQLGHTGAAGALLAIVAAAAAAAERGAACVALSLAEPRQRLALVARPASAQAPAHEPANR